MLAVTSQMDWREFKTKGNLIIVKPFRQWKIRQVHILFFCILELEGPLVNCRCSIRYPRTPSEYEGEEKSNEKQS